MRPFAFRQRVGNVNWRAVSSVDVERVVDDNRIEELQAIVDEVTFCDVRTADIKGNTIHNTKKLIHLMQLMLEYLLYCQESQLLLVRDLHEKNNKMKQINKAVTQKFESAKEDIRIYRRQIAMMKESMNSLGMEDPTVEKPPRKFNPLEKENSSPCSNMRTNAADISPLIDSMLLHERETRNFVKDVIQEQRALFLSELDALNRRSSSPSRPDAHDIERQLQNNVEVILKELRKANSRSLESGSSDELESERKKLREFERELERREDRLTMREDKVVSSEEKLAAREKDIQNEKHDLDMRILEFRNRIENSQDKDKFQKEMTQHHSVGVNTLPLAAASLKSNPTTLTAFNMLMRTVRRGNVNKCQFAFLHWKSCTIRDRHDGRVVELESEVSNKINQISMLTEQIETLKAKLSSEKEKNIIESARVSTLNKKLKDFEEKSKLLSAQVDQAVNTSIDVRDLKKIIGARSLEDDETEDQMFESAIRRIESHMIDPDMGVIVENLAKEIIGQVPSSTDDAS